MLVSDQRMSARVGSMLRVARCERMLAMVCLVLLAAGAAHALSYKYVGTAPTGQGTDWFNSKNWDPIGVPGASDDATIDTTTVPILTSGQTVQVTNLTLKDAGTITGGTVTVTGTLTMTGGGFIDSTVFANGGMEIKSGTQGAAALNGTALESRGTVHLLSGGLTLIEHGGTPAIFKNFGTFNIGGTAQITRPAGNTSLFLNFGTFRTDPNQLFTPMSLVTSVNKSDLFFRNQLSGTVEAGDGTLTFDTHVDNLGVFRTGGETAVIKITSGGLLTSEDITSLNGPGIVEVNGQFFLKGGAIVSADRIRLKSVGGIQAHIQMNDNSTLLALDFDMQDGFINGPTVGRGTVKIQRTLTISGDNALANMIVNNFGTANMSNGAKITAVGDGTFSNDGRVNITGGQFISTTPDMVFNNNANGVISNLSGQTTVGWKLNNNGSVETQQGTLILSGTVTSSKTFTAAANSTIEFFNGNADFGPGTKLEGAGLFLGTGSGTINLSGTSIPVTKFVLIGDSKTITGGGSFDVSNNFDWSRGNMQGAGLNIQSGATLHITSANGKNASGSTITNNGAANFDSTVALTLNDGSTFNNSGTFDYTSPNNADIGQSTGTTSTFNNSGTFNVSGGTPSGAVNIVPAFITNGTLNLHVSRLDYFHGYTQTGGTFSADNNATLQAEGGIPIKLQAGQFFTGSTFTFISSGGGVNNTGANINPGGALPGLINIPFGPFSQSDNGVLSFGIGGTGAGTQYDQMNVSGNAILGGTINVQSINGFVPQAGNTFQLIPYGSHAGIFPIINGLTSFGSDRLLLPLYGNTSFSLVTSLINSAQNGPVINSVVTNAGSTTVQGTFSGTPNIPYTIYIFTNPPPPSGPTNAPLASSTCDNANQTLVGSINVTTNSAGSASFTITLPTPLLVGQFVTAIATDAGLTSSKFSQCAQVTTGGSTVQFSAATTSAAENVGSIALIVLRTNGTTGAASVDYATSDTAGASNCAAVNTGTANSRCDYEATSGTLHFAPGEASKTILIPIIDDVYAEGAENFTVTLSNASGAVLGLPNVATVTINDNETTTGTNPINQPNFFVRLHYIDFFTREPDSGGLAFWTNQITECGTDQTCVEIRRINVSAAFYLSIEFQDTGYLVERIYRVAYGNATGTSTLGGTHQLPVPIVRFNEFLPDTQQIGNGVVVGQAGWEQVLENNKQAFMNEFVQRSRFTTSFPSNMTPSQFVDALNLNAGNALSMSERNQLVSDLTSGARTRAQVLRAVAEDSDLNTAEFNRAFVLMQFYGYLRRNPNDAPDGDYTGYDFWLGKLNQFGGNFVNAEMVKAFIVSDEYKARFGP